jgi:DNA-binding transcriptional MerR regulator
MEPRRTRIPMVPRFSQPVRQILTMVLVLVLVALGAWAIHEEVEAVFRTNLWLNGTILFVFILGIFACFIQVAQLTVAVGWIEGFARNRPGYEPKNPPRLLVPLFALLDQGRSGRMQLSSTSTRTILDTVEARIDEGRDITRYVANLLIFLGLLGTFFGLATTIPAVVSTIGALNPQPGEESLAVFARLMAGLNEQLGGMGTAFSSSLLGLSGSLVIGLLELFAGHGQRRFYRELEEWLSSMTRVGLMSGGEGVSQEAVAELMDHLSEQMEVLARLHETAEERRALLDQRIGMLADAVERLARRVETDADAGQAMGRLAGIQEHFFQILSDREERAASLEAESRMRLRSLDEHLMKVLHETTAGREASTYDLRADIAQLTAAVKSLGVRRG